MTRPDRLYAVQGALKRLKLFAEVSSMADIAANTLTRLLGKAADTRKDTGTETDTGTDEALTSQNQEAGNAATQ